MSDKEIHEDLLKVLKQLGEWEKELDYAFEGDLIGFRKKLVENLERVDVKSNYESVVVDWDCPICDTNWKSDFGYDNGGWIATCDTCGLNVDLIPM